MAEYEKRVRDKLAEHGCSFVRHGKEVPVSEGVSGFFQNVDELRVGR